jgi:hypothetical protein
MDLDQISQQMYNGFCRKYPEIDTHHFKPEIVKSIIIKSGVNYHNQDGLKSIIRGLNEKLNHFKQQINKDRQQKGTIDFTLDPKSIVSKQPVPQQALVIATPPKPPHNLNHSRREFLNPNPVIISDPGNQNQIPLNQLVTRNQEIPNYQSFPAHPKDLNLSSLGDSIEESNQSDHFILTATQRNLLKEQNNTAVRYLIIDSKDRDFDMSPYPNSYTIKFSPPNFNNSDIKPGYIDRTFHNVESIELVKCGLLNTADQGDASDNSSPPAYISLEIDEFKTQHHSTNQGLRQTITILDTHTSQNNYKYFNLLYGDLCAVVKFNPRITLDKLTIRFKLPNGELYNFGEANKNSTTTVNFLVLKVTYLEKNLQTDFFN